MKPAELIQQINEIHGTAFTLVERYEQGEQGAFAIVDPDERRYVLKWQPRLGLMSRLQYARTVTDRLRTRGYPAPEYIWIGRIPGGIYSIQTVLPGSPVLLPVTDAQLSHLIALNELQIDQAPPGLRDWPREVVHTVLFGEREYCVHTSLQQHSSETAEMLQELKNIALQYKDEITRKNDIVHFDYNPANILVHNQEVSGIIDWDGGCAGDAAFDLATLLFYIYDDVALRERLWRYALG